MSKEPLVSACIITYNQEKFIRECIEGALSQNIENYEIVIGDDCSSDSTSMICQEYQEKFPNLIRYIKRNKNLGMIGNWLDTINQCKGEFIAICEGDDYWNDPNKLFNQMNFLNNNSDYGLLFSDYDLLSDTKGSFVHSYHKIFNTFIPKTNTFEHLLYVNPFVTCTSFFRSCILDDFNHDFRAMKIHAIDCCIWLHIAASWKVGYLNSSTSTYRVLENSASHTTDFQKEIEMKELGIQTTRYFAKYYGVEFNEEKKRYLVNKSLIKSVIQKNRFYLLIKFKSYPFTIFKESIKELILKPLFLLFKKR